MLGIALAAFGGALLALAAVGLALFLLRGAALNWAVDRSLVRLLKDPYRENLWELVLGFTRMSPHILLETELRAETGRGLERPLGSIVRPDTLSGVAFNPAQFVRPPLGPREEVDLTVSLGPRARRPLRLQMPILIGGMGYGVALSKPFSLALLQGANQAGTAYNAGSGPVLDEVLREADRLILQYGGGPWNRDPEQLAQANMIEIRLGHGARASLGRIIPGDLLPAEARRLMGIEADGDAVVSAPVPGAASPAELRRLVPELRRLMDGGPVGVKLAATHDLERELAAVLEAGVDVIALDGAEGGTHGSPPAVADDFGIPTVHALHRAVHFLERTGARRAVSLVAGGGLRTPGEMLKVLALGADAVCIGTAALMATTHGQLSRTVPFEPVTGLVWADSRQADAFDPEEGARTLANFLQACASEMAEACRALGRSSVRAVTRADLLARNGETARALGLPPTWRPPAG